VPRFIDEVRVLVNGKSDEVFDILLDASKLPKVRHTERTPYGPLKKGTIETIHFPWFQSATYKVVELNRRTRRYAVTILQAPCSARGTVHVEVGHAVGGCEIALALDITSSLSRPPCRDWLTVILASRIEEQLSFLRVLDQ
jgi:hypothetical protein